MIATSKDAYVKSDNKNSRNRNKIYTKEEIERIVCGGNPVERAELSEFFFMTNGLYKRIILHYATFLTYSWLLVPQPKKRNYTVAEKGIPDAYYKASDFCTNFQIERKCANFTKDILVKGAYYGLINYTDNNAVIQDLPFDYCRSRFKNENDIDIVELNLAFFETIKDENLRKEILKTYPKIIGAAYNKYKYNNGPKWIFLPPEMGIYLAFFEERPFFLDLIPLLDDLDEYKDIDKARNLQSLRRILVQRIGTDGMNLVFEPDEAEEMHEGAIGMLANNQDVDVLTTYANVDLLDLSSDDDEKTQVQDVQNLILETAGVSKEFFFATTEAGLNFSTNNDLAMMMILAPRLAKFFTSIINYKYETKKVKFKLLILPLSYYNTDKYASYMKELGAFGYSFLTPIAASGIDQVDLPYLKALENEILDLDQILKPLQSSYTQSGKAQGEPVGDSNDTSSNNEEDKKEEDDTKNKEAEE